MTACIQNEEFCKLYSETYHMVPATNLSPERELYTTNYLMSETLNQNYYDSRVLGGKTGFTTPAGRCLITVSESAGMKLVIVIMGAEAEFAEDGYTRRNEAGDRHHGRRSRVCRGRIHRPQLWQL